MLHLEDKMNILKKTKSICPTCFIEIDAKIIEKNNKVYMVKECPKHGEFTGIVEKDVEFYKKTITNNHPVKRNKYSRLLIPFTHKCNLNCNFCWLPQRNREDFSIEVLKNIILNSSCKEVRICGGEPTVRDDLPDLIRFIKNNKKKSVIITNGLKLANLDYVKELKDAGLDVVCFSFNGFRDDIYKKLNSRKLLQIKLKALENLKKLNIPTIMSVMVINGVNDKELKRIFDYCIENNSFIRELRIRSSACIGKYNESDIFFVSDMITSFSKILNIDRKEFLKIIDRKKRMSCSYSIEIISYKQDGTIHPWLLIKKTADYRKTISKIQITTEMLRRFKIKSFLKYVINKIKNKNNLILRLEFRSWPNKYNIDIIDIEKRCSTRQLSKNGEFPFCYSLILNNENIIEL